MGAIGGEELQQWEKMQEAPEAGKERIVVSVRLRPLNDKEIARNDVLDWECINNNTIIFRSNLPERSVLPSAYTFDRVFRSNCSTKEVYEKAAKEIALSVVSGINSSIFAYGQTSSGKTFTMSGITEYTIADIYDYMEEHQERAFVLKFSAIEIYNEAVKDLLSADGTPLRLLDDPERGTVVERLIEETLRDRNHLQELLYICEAQRQVGETGLNEISSRSHQILKLTIESSARESLEKENSSTLAASVNFVDLAGSERASQALSAGTRLKEGCHINRSLLTLGTVIRKLSKGRSGHIPYRDSKLTRILQSSLGGNARTAIICTMSPARSHNEQSRNTLLFATCANEVATNAQVNVVMSEKALVKHLQKELARLESELRGTVPTSNASNFSALLRERDIQIQKMEKEMKGLIQQRDLAQSRLEDLLRVVGEDQASRLWAEFNHHPISHASNACEDDLSVSESSGLADHSLDFGFTKLNKPQYSKEFSDSDMNEDYLQLSDIPEDQMLFGSTSPRLSINSPESTCLVPQESGQEISQETKDDIEDLCKDVRCIETDELNANRKEETNNTFLPEGNEMPVPLTVYGFAYVKGEGDESTEGDKELQHVATHCANGAAEKQVHHVPRTFDSLEKTCSDEPSSSPSVADISSSRRSSLTRSRSCRAAFMASSYTPGFAKVEENENTPPGVFEKDFPGRPGAGVLQRRPCALNYEIESREHSQSSEQDASLDMLTPQNTKAAAEEKLPSICSFVAELKEMAQLQYQKKLDDKEAGQEAGEDFGTEKTSKDVGLDPIQTPLQSPSNSPMEFARQQREIIELWHACNVSLVHRTYFFLLFKGDPADSIYMEVELRRLSFLKNTFSQGNHGKEDVENDLIVTPASSTRALRRERELLSKHMQKRFSESQRDSLYKKWGIGLSTKQRRLQLARLLWTNTNDMDHVKDSADIVAKLVGFSEQGQALKEMFGLSFRPQLMARRSFGKKIGSMNSFL